MFRRKRRAKPPKDFLRVTSHEAGHALVAWRTGLPLRYITVFPWASTRTRGECHFDALALSPTDPSPSQWSVDYFDSLVMSYFGGPEAERRFRWGDDTSEFSLGSASDMDQAARLCGIRLPSSEEAIDYAGKLQEKTRTLVKDPLNWRAIETLASYLLEHYTVMAPRMEAIFRAEVGTAEGWPVA